MDVLQLFICSTSNLTVESVTSWDAEESDSSVEQKYNAKVGLNLNNIRDRTGDLMGDVVWDILPDSLSVGYGFGEIDLGSASDKKNRSKSIGADASWWWSSGDAYLGYWYSLSDNRQPGAEDYDWEGDGIYGGGSVKGDRWTLGGSLNLARIIHGVV